MAPSIDKKAGATKAPFCAREIALLSDNERDRERFKLCPIVPFAESPLYYSYFPTFSPPTTKGRALNLNFNLSGGSKK